jgi:hypothetical protein
VRLERHDAFFDRVDHGEPIMAKLNKTELAREVA